MAAGRVRAAAAKVRGAVGWEEAARAAAATALVEAARAVAARATAAAAVAAPELAAAGRAAAGMAGVAGCSGHKYRVNFESHCCCSDRWCNCTARAGSMEAAQTL